MIVARDLTVGRRIRRLDGVNLALAPGELVVVLGPNGSGKSTLVRSLCGEVRLDGGAIEMGGRPVACWRRREAAQRRAVLLQEIAVQFPFRVDEVVRLGRAPHRTGDGVDREIVAAALETTAAGHLAERRYGTLSGGERQRVQLARVLAQIWEPPPSGARYLLLDEPTANLDPAHQHRVLSLARRFARNGVAVLAVVHDLQLCALYADRLVLVDRGRIVAEGTPGDVLRPAVIETVFGVRTVEVRDEAGRTHLIANAEAPAHVTPRGEPGTRKGLEG